MPGANPAGAKKSKWAEDSEEEEEEEDKSSMTAAPKPDQNADLVSQARDVGDAASALDMLEDRLGRRMMSTVSAETEGRR